MRNKNTHFLSKITVFAFAWLTLIFFGVATLAHATERQNQKIDSDSLLYISDVFLKTKAKNVLSQILNHLDLKSANQNLGTSPTIQLNQIEAVLSPTSFSISDIGDGLSVVTKNNTLQLNVGEIAIHDTIERNVNGIIAIIRVDVSCVGAKVIIADPLSVISAQLVPLVNGPQLEIHFTSPVVRLAQPKMQISNFQCRGAQGLDTLIKSRLQEALNNTQSTNDFIAKILSEKNVVADTRLTFDWATPRVLFGNAADPTSLQGIIAPNQINVTKNDDWQLLSNLELSLPTTPLTAPLKFNHWPLDIKTKTGYVALPEQTPIELTKRYFAPGYWHHKDLANNSKGFADLLASRFLEFFLWPDLERYPKHQPFPIDVTTTATPEVRWQSATSLFVKTKFLVQMFTNNAPYANFDIPFESEIQLSVENDELIFKPTNAKLSVSARWAPSYCDNERCGSISTSTIADAVQSYVNDQKFSFALPPIEFEGSQIHAESLRHEAAQKAVILRFSPN
jgi:hypothetical protein